MISKIGVAARLAALLSIAILVTGCQATSQYAGSGGLRLSPEVTQLYRQYQNKSRPASFLVSVDGRCGTFSFCPGHAWACKHSPVGYNDIDSCKYSCREVPCRVLAIGRTIVWQGPVIGDDGVYIHKPVTPPAP